MKAIVVAGTHSGCGKTSVSLGLMAALKRRGLAVQPFKTGPDFIDPGHHRLVTGRPSHNLDGWMCTRTDVEGIFQRYAADADIAVVEGVMGLFDGFSAVSESGSTAEIAKWLGCPVLLVVDARSMARSAAATVTGYTRFDPELSFAGAAFNRVGSENHADILREAMQHSLPHVPVIGCLPRREDIAAPSRHLGLVTAEETEFGPEQADRLADWVENALDLDGLLASLPEISVQPAATHTAPARVRIAYALDRAFCFYYPENLRLLEEAGAELVPFSPLADKQLPENIHGLYLGGGYPELYAFELSNNRSLRKDIKRFSGAGHPVYAECGGFMYLMESVRNQHGQNCQMAGVFPLRAEMNERLRALGYRQITTTADSILGPAGTMARGHEFHYSHIGDEAYGQAGLYDVADRKGPRATPEGFVSGNTVGSYVHLHFASNPSVCRHFVDACARLG